jgi:hypothetical protein
VSLSKRHFEYSKNYLHFSRRALPFPLDWYKNNCEGFLSKRSKKKRKKTKLVFAKFSLMRKGVTFMVVFRLDFLTPGNVGNLLQFTGYFSNLLGTFLDLLEAFLYLLGTFLNLFGTFLIY